MKFLCDNCKAKYQIADEKVAGKTVRMKCRKCGHQIEVRAAVTETGASSHAPPKTPDRPAGPRPLATSLSATKPRAPSRSDAPPSALAGAFQRTVTDAPAATAAPTPIELSVSDEWYVAINGVPVGPVRISELRRKAASGAVTEESLCWQEGLEEWRPIRSIPELAALVREAAQGQRPSLVSAEPVPARSTIPPAPPRPPTPPTPPAAPRPVGAPRPPAATPAPPAARPPSPSAPGRSNVVPLRPAAAASPLVDRASDDFGLGLGNAAPAYIPTPSPMHPVVTGPQPMVAPTPAPVADPFALPPAPAVAAPTPMFAEPPRPSTMPPPPAGYDGRRSVPLWFWPVLVLSLGFGGGLAFLVFRPQPAPAPVVIHMPQTAAPTSPAPPPPNAEREPPAAEPATSTAAADAKRPTSSARSNGGAKAASQTGQEEKKGLDLSGLVPPSGGGPNVNGGGGAAAAGGGLDQAGVERVVAGHKVGVRRTCWERGGGDKKSTVNVTVTTNVAPNGTVASTSSSGDDPVVGKCIENQVRTWTFPAPGSPTTIAIPFKFIPQ